MRVVARVVAVCVVYLVVGRLAVALAIPPGYATAFWPGAGVALIAVLRWGRPVALGVVLGSVLTNLGTSGSPGDPGALIMVVGVGLGAAAQAIVGAALIRRHVGFPSPLTRERDIGGLLALGGPVACTIAPTTAVALLAARGEITVEQVARQWFTWWVGDTIGVLLVTPLALVWLARPVAQWRARRAVVTVPLVVCTGLSVPIFFYASAQEDQRVRSAFGQDTARLADAVRGTLVASAETIYAIRSYLESAGTVDRAGFARFVGRALDRNPAIQALSWNPRVPQAERAAYEDAARRDGLVAFGFTERDPTGRLVPAPARADYTIAFFIEPRAGNEAALGFNLVTAPGRTEALDRARDTGELATTSGVTLVQETGRQLGVLSVVPVYDRALPEGRAATVAARRAHLRGFAVGVVRLTDLLTTALRGFPLRGIAARLVDVTPGAPVVELATVGGDRRGPSPAAARFALHVPIELGGRRWQLSFWPDPAYLARHESWLPYFVLGAGLLFTSLLGAFLLVLTGRAAAVEALVSERTRALSRSVAEREQAEQQVRALIESAPDAFVLLTADGKVALVNAEAEALFGYDRGELVGRAVETLMPVNVAELDPALRGDGRRGVVELRGRRKDGGEVPLEVRVSRLDTPEGVRLSTAIRDVSERQRLEELRTERAALVEQNLRIQQANRLKSEFVAHMSHELRTPLHAIIGFAELMHDGRVGPVSAQHKELLGDILTSSTHLLGLIDDVLDLSRIEAGKADIRIERVEPGPLVRAVVDALGTLTAGKRLRVTVELTDELDRLWTDPAKLRQILFNYLANAIKFSHERGQVRVTLTRVDARRFRLAVADDGIGIAPADQGRLFQPFQQLDSGPTKRHGGTGLGLAITRELAELLGGTVGVQSAPGQGSRFWVELPIDARREPGGWLDPATVEEDA